MPMPNPTPDPGMGDGFFQRRRFTILLILGVVALIAALIALVIGVRSILREPAKAQAAAGADHGRARTSQSELTDRLAADHEIRAMSVLSSAIGSTARV